MTADEIKAKLTQALKETGLILQIKQMGPQLIIMVNCPKQKADANFQDAASLLMDIFKHLANNE